MKKRVKQYAQQTKQGGKDKHQVLKEFSRILDDQIEKTVLFLLEQQGILASRIQALGGKRISLLEQPDIALVYELREGYREVGQDLLKLLRFIDANATGIRKILKKFDKRMGHTFTSYYVTTRSNHPYSQLQQGIGAVVGALSRNLAYLQDRRGSYLSIYDDPSIALKDPIIDLINSSVDKLTHSTNFLQFLGQRSLIIHEAIPSSEEDSVDDGRFNFMSLLLNLANTFLYMVNTYIIVPTADDYALSLGAAATVCGVIIGSMAVAQVFSSVYFSAWSNRSYFKPLVFSSIMLLIGNTFYAMAYDVRSLPVLLIGRLLCGLGSARAVNRRYISDCVPLKIRMKASAAFVSASALGMACGPALAGLLQTRFKIYSITFNRNTLPGWVMAISWLFYLLWLWLSFKEPSHDDRSHLHQNVNSGDNQAEVEDGTRQPLLLNSNEDGDLECDDSEETLEKSHKPANSIASAYRLLTPSVKNDARLRWSPSGHTSRCEGVINSCECEGDACLLRLARWGGADFEAAIEVEFDAMGEIKAEPSATVEVEMELGSDTKIDAGQHILILKLMRDNAVQLLVYFMLKYATEILLSESSVITTLYFNWSTSAVAIFLAVLGLTVLPVNAVVGSYITNMFEDRQILLASEIMVLVGIILSFRITASYSVAQYVCAALITFVAAEVLEGVNLSLLSEVMSSRLARGTFNGGLLSTEAGTLARVIADGTITLAGYLGEGLLLNVTLFPSLLICIASIAATFLTYNTLY
ncbi:SPX domain-containing membrane protein [Apostasia shenzhenica]|uniref:SPX domain-containing membrane protein n=1 Tax=Apostasia shenzhenica TaxID=1088818 RepID=A0A2I0AX24_9ASPA|nr:SPX domain-containing membrane protein [Apostasia shenzhenica]